MKGKKLFITALIALAAGLVLLLMHRTITGPHVITACGALFIVAALTNVFLLGSKDKNGRARVGAVGNVIGWIASAAALLLGLSMILFRQTFVTLVSFMFGVLIACGAVFQLFLLLGGSRPVRLSGWFYLVPMLMAIAAVYIFIKPVDQIYVDAQRTSVYTNELMLVTGLAFTLFGVATMVEGVMISRANYVSRKETDQALRGLGANSAARKADAKARLPKPDGGDGTASSAAPGDAAGKAD